jgi:adenine-specific DNA methylase
MIPKECKRLAEVDFPIAAVSAHSAREKSIRHGHPSTLHLWWARRPLAACRSMLMALLLPDPCDPHCPREFKDEARRILNEFPGRPQRWDEQLKTGEGLRRAILHEFIADFANWDNAANPAYLKTARALVKAAHGPADPNAPYEPPLVVDPFAGGGSIPLEALRIGCDAFASDLNPVACLINKVLLEDIPRHGPKLAEELRRVGAEIKKQAEKELAEFYPPDPDGARPIAYLWARTVRCEQPNCGCEIPLVRSFWLCTKPSRRLALSLTAHEHTKGTPILQFDILRPKSESEVQAGTVSNSKATCPACHKVLSGDRVRAQLSQQAGGADVVFDSTWQRVGGARLLAVVVLREGAAGRQYRLPLESDYACVASAAKRTRDSTITPADSLKTRLNPIRPSPNARGFSAVTRYGIATVKQLFTARQLVALRTISKLVSAREIGSQALLAFAVSKLADLACSLCRWEPIAECPRQLFTRHAAAIAWDFAEGVPISDASGGFAVCVDNVLGGLGSLDSLSRAGTTVLSDAAETGLPTDGASVWFTDPPYYDAIPYADLSDFFFAWLKQCLPNSKNLRDPYDATNLGTPKLRECVWNQAYSVNGRPKDGRFFEACVSSSFTEARRFLHDDGIGGVVFAHSTTEGWESLLSGIINGGWTVSGSWPIATEMGSRIRARNTAALATSVHLVCRPRDNDAGVGDWGEIIRELPMRIGDWMERLSGEGIRGADLVFACIGPALELFSKYARVETPDGEEVGLAANDKARGEPARRGFLSYVWEVAGRTALNQVLGSEESLARNGAAGALEEDARLTALFLWTLQATEAAANGKKQSRARKQAVDDENEADDAGEGNDENEETGAKKGKKKAGLSLIYDVARRFAQPLGIHLDVWEGRIIETAKGVVRLLPVRERAKQLFGDDGASGLADRIESDARKARSAQMMLFPEGEPAPKLRGRGRSRKTPTGTPVSDEALRTRREATTLDRVHAAMLLQASGRSNALRALLKAEQDRGPDFLRLANALSALYPRDSEEKRLLDAMLLAVPR